MILISGAGCGICKTAKKLLQFFMAKTNKALKQVSYFYCHKSKFFCYIKKVIKNTCNF
jgi:hypothetical protein